MLRRALAAQLGGALQRGLAAWARSAHATVEADTRRRAHEAEASGAQALQAVQQRAQQASQHAQQQGEATATARMAPRPARIKP